MKHLLTLLGVQCEVRLDYVPADGRKHRTVFVNVTDKKDYLFQFTKFKAPAAK